MGKKVRNLEGIRTILKKSQEEYLPSVMTDEEDLYKLKTIVNNLPEVDRIIFLAYVELRSFSELSKVLGISRSSCFWTIKRIREEIIRQYKRSNL